MAKPSTIWSRNSSDGKATFSVVEFEELNMIIASVDLIGYEITYRRYETSDSKGLTASIINSEAKHRAITYAESAWELYDKLSEFGFMDYIDFGDKLYGDGVTYGKED